MASDARLLPKAYNTLDGSNTQVNDFNSTSISIFFLDKDLEFSFSENVYHDYLKM